MEDNTNRMRVQVKPYTLEERELNTLPEFGFPGAKFELDVDLWVLRDKDNALNIISLDDLKNKGDHYELEYSTMFRNTPVWSEPKYDHILELDQLVKADPYGMAKKYGVDISELPDRDADLKCRPELLAWREKGSLPVIDIAKDPFVVDWAQRQLRFKDHKIDLQYPNISEDGLSIEFFYNTRTKSEVKISSNLTDLPVNVVLVKIPNELKLDPWAVAKELDLKMEPWLNKNPIQQQFTAKVTPLWQTHINQMAIDNRNAKRAGRALRTEKKGRQKVKHQRYA